MDVALVRTGDNGEGRVARKSLDVLCAYCGGKGALTRDHVPPRAIFPDDPAHRVNLITVPACQRCHGKFSSDDQYVHLWIAGHALTNQNPIASKLHPRADRGASHVKRARMGRKIRRSLRLIRSRTASGLYADLQPMLMLDLVAVQRFGVRLIRGLHFHRFEQPVAAHLDVVCGPLEDLASRTQLYSQRLKPMVQSLEGEPLHDVGQGVFKFRFRHSERVEVTTWLMSFYDSIEFLGQIRPKESVPRIQLLP
jgi:hypothetical protein